MIFKIAWRNILRNKRRSIISVLLSILCVAVLMFFQGLNDGGHEKMIADNVEVYSGYLQIHGQGYQENGNYDHLIFDLDEVLEKIKDVKGIKAQTIRLETFALFSAKEDAIGGMLVGINPENEAKISRIKRALSGGRYLSASDTNAVYLGEDLAKRLEVKIGDELVFISSALDYSMAAAKLKVCGFFKTNLFDFDKRTAFVNKVFLDQEFLADNTASHIIIFPENLDRLNKIQKNIKAVLPKGKYEVMTYQETLEAILQFINLDNAFGALTFGLLALIVFFVVMIFSLISILQRTKEIGIMRAIGTTQEQIYKMLLAEGLIFALASIFIGGAIGTVLNYYFQNHPMQFTADPSVVEMYRQFGMVDLVIPAKISFYSLFLGVIPVFLLNILSVLYPAWLVNKMRPIDAIEERQD
jgi:ABC-type lipoprotein release transport system permease subunit